MDYGQTEGWPYMAGVMDRYSCRRPVRWAVGSLRPELALVPALHYTFLNTRRGGLSSQRVQERQFGQLV